MLTLQMPMLLALLGTALMAVVIFAPSRVPRPVTMSLAPPIAPAAVDHWEQWARIDRCEPSARAAEPADAAGWPALVDPRASACDAAARLGLVDALAAVRSPWSDTILHRAIEDEADPTVHAAVVAALLAQRGDGTARA